jgi:tRNA threonylcarbamoyladenosine biosynthesis protein TsaB
MIFLTIRTDKPEAEIGLFEGHNKLEYEVWQAHRQLAETIHLKIRDLLSKHGLKLNNLGGIVCFEGPGSFTGLRIGLAVGNALAFALSVPIAATGGDNWIEIGLKKLLDGQSDQIALPKYGSPVHITEPKK